MNRMLHHTFRPLHLLSLSGVLALGIHSSAPACAQQPVLRSATRATVHRAALAQSEPAAPAAPADPQSPPSPPAPPAPPAMKDDLFNGTERFAKGASGVTEVNMGPDSLNLVGGSDAPKAHRTLLSVVRTYTYDKPGMYNMADVEEFRHRLESGDWQCSVHTRDMKSGESTDVCSKRRGSDMVEHAIITVSPKSLTFIHNIRRANGQGGRMDWGDTPGVFVFPGEAMMAPLGALGPEIAAEMLAHSAELQAHAAEMAANSAAIRAEMLANVDRLRAEMPRLDTLKNFRPMPDINSDEIRTLVDRQMRDLPQKMKGLEHFHLDVNPAPNAIPQPK